MILAAAAGPDPSGSAVEPHAPYCAPVVVQIVLAIDLDARSVLCFRSFQLTLGVRPIRGQHWNPCMSLRSFH